MASKTIAIGKQIHVGRKVASIDAKYGPYESCQAAQDALGSNGADVIAEGLTVGIIDIDGSIVEYWWKGGTSIEYLVRKVNIGEIGDIINVDRPYIPEAYSGMGKVYLKKNLVYSGLHFSRFVVDLNPIEQTSLNGSPDEIVYETSSERFVGIKRNGIVVKYYISWLDENSNAYIHPSNEYNYICNFDKKCYFWNGESIVEKTEMPKANLLTQDMLNKENTIYVIQYDFGLSGPVSILSEESGMSMEGYYAKKKISVPLGSTLRAVGDCYFRDNHTGDVIGNVADSNTDVDLCLDCNSVQEASEANVLTYYVVEGITVPNNCVLLFDGGSINDGQIDLNGCEVFPTYESVLGNNLYVVGNPKAGTTMWDAANERPMWNNGEDWEPCKTNDIVDDDLQMTQAQINAIVIGSAVSVSLAASSNTVFPGQNTISLTATCSTAASSIKIKKGSTVIATGSGTSLTTSYNLTTSEAGDTAFTAEFVVGGLTKTATRNVKTVYPILYGAGSDYTDAQNEASVRTTPAGTYTIEVATGGDYVFFVVPRGMNINSAKLGIFEFPLEAPVNCTIGENNLEYKYYKSSNTYVAGTLTIVIS